jgi:hypothetical protein
MGCSPSRANPEKAQNNPNDAINQVITINPGCGLAGTAENSLGKYIPDNGEYIWAGENGSCHYCSLDAGVEAAKCDSGCADISCCAIIGARGSYKRTKYLADPLTCCLQEKATIGNLTCDPKYRSNTKSDCRSYLTEYCENTTNFPEPICQSFCNNELDAKRSTCDNAINKYCESNPTDVKCKCAYPPQKIQDLKKKIDPNIIGDITCWYDGCQSTNRPYLTLNMHDTKNNCKTTNCIIKDVDVNTSGNVTIKNNCGLPVPPSHVPHQEEESIKPNPKPKIEITELIVIISAIIIIMIIIH